VEFADNAADAGVIVEIIGKADLTVVDTIDNFGRFYESRYARSSGMIGRRGLGERDHVSVIDAVLNHAGVGKADDAADDDVGW